MIKIAKPYPTDDRDPLDPGFGWKQIKGPRWMDVPHATKCLPEECPVCEGKGFITVIS